MTAYPSPYGTTYTPDPATVNGEHGYRDETGEFHSLRDLEQIARAVILRRPDYRSAADILREVASEEQIVDLLISDVFDYDDIAAWALNPDTGKWEAGA